MSASGWREAQRQWSNGHLPAACQCQCQCQRPCQRPCQRQMRCSAWHCIVSANIRPRRTGSEACMHVDACSSLMEGCRSGRRHSRAFLARGSRTRGSGAALPRHISFYERLAHSSRQKLCQPTLPECNLPNPSRPLLLCERVVECRFWLMRSAAWEAYRTSTHTCAIQYVPL